MGDDTCVVIIPRDDVRDAVAASHLCLHGTTIGAYLDPRHRVCELGRDRVAAHGHLPESRRGCRTRGRRNHVHRPAPQRRQHRCRLCIRTADHRPHDSNLVPPRRVVRIVVADCPHRIAGGEHAVPPRRRIVPVTANLQQVVTAQSRQFALAVALAEIRVHDCRQCRRVTHLMQQILLGVCCLPQRKVERGDATRPDHELMRLGDTEAMLVDGYEAAVLRTTIDAMVVRDADHVVAGGGVRGVHCRGRTAARCDPRPCVRVRMKVGPLPRGTDAGIRIVERSAGEWCHDLRPVDRHDRVRQQQHRHHEQRERAHDTQAGSRDDPADSLRVVLGTRHMEHGRFVCGHRRGRGDRAAVAGCSPTHRRAKATHRAPKHRHASVTVRIGPGKITA